VPKSLSGGQRQFLFTSESVSEGHPDKICDQISDAIVDTYIVREPEARLAIETLATTNRIIIAGEIKSIHPLDKAAVAEIARQKVKQIGYEQGGFHWQHAEIEVLLHDQSPDIAQGVDAAEGKEEGAGDQGIMFGYACNETPSLMPAPIYYAHNILRAISDDVHAGRLKDLGPDAKSQVTLLYEDGKPVKAHTVLVSIQHKPHLNQKQVRELVRGYVERVLPEGWMCPEERFYVNPTGQFIIGGPDSDCGLTGRKIIVDTYGGAAPHGGGAFSGKDPTKVDRSAAYAARYLAKNVVASGVAEECTIQIAYAIGISKPLAFYVNTHGTSTYGDDVIATTLQEMMDLSPKGIRTHLQLNRPIYERTAAYGHFGREPEKDGGFSWEKVDLAEELRQRLEKK
jgi:S-adenosylmethionine synthetase